MNTTSTTATVVQVAPAELLTDRNVRVQVSLDKTFTSSVRDHGVLVPVVAVRTAEGGLRVRLGHRRTAAAIEAGVETIPVVVVADEATSDGAEVERLVEQWAENEHRTGLSWADKLNTIEQLSLLGVSAAQIAKRTKAARRQVDAALAVSGSELARAVACRYDFLDLVQAAVIADFDADGEAVKALVKAARDGGFDHLAQQLRDERDEAQQLQQLADELTAQGVTVVDRPAYNSTAARLDELGNGKGKPLDADKHTGCPGHGAYIGQGWDYTTDGPARRTAAAVYLCTDPKGNGHQPRYASSTPARVPADQMTDEQREQAKTERRTVIANNKAWASAETVRRAWLRSFLTRKTAPKNIGRFVANALIYDTYQIHKGTEGGHDRARDLFGCDEPDASTYVYGAHTAQVAALLDGATDSRAHVIALGVILAGYEDSLNPQSWRSHNDATARYLGFLTEHGYELSDVERLASGLTEGTTGS